MKARTLPKKHLPADPVASAGQVADLQRARREDDGRGQQEREPCGVCLDSPRNMP